MVTAPHSFAWLAWLASDTPIIVHSSIAASASEGLGDLASKPAQRSVPSASQDSVSASAGARLAD